MIYDIIIIGAGPAGMTSALYALRANKKVLLIDFKVYGGQIINAGLIENYPGIANISGFNFANNLYNQIKELKIEFKNEKVVEITRDKRVITNKNKYRSKTIIIATGLEKRKLNIENEDKLIGKGISYCAICDGNFYRQKIVAIVGGGNSALKDALYMSDIASKVYLIHRNNNFKGEEINFKKLKNKNNVEIITNSIISKIIGNEKLEKIILNDNKEISIDGLFIAIGQVPHNEIFNNILKLDDGYVWCDNNLQTKIEGIFVAGDTRVKELRQLTTAISDGSIAATQAINYINSIDKNI